jgi:predicted nucleotide-binding protein (sugar kinase/HSP70/actin superfamily)
MPRTQVGFPRLGSFGVFLKPALRTLGLDLVVAPPSSQRTLDLGVRHNPEMICAPCKLLFGNYIEALEQGCQVLVMLGGPGTYGEVTTGTALLSLCADVAGFLSNAGY